MDPTRGAAVIISDENVSASSAQSAYENAVLAAASQRNEIAEHTVGAFCKSSGGRKISPISCGIPLTSTFGRHQTTTTIGTSATNAAAANSYASANIIQQKFALLQRQKFSDLRRKCSPPVFSANNNNAASQTNLAGGGCGENGSPKTTKRFASASAGMESLANRFADLCGTTKKYIKTQKPNAAAPKHKYSLEQHIVPESENVLAARNSKSLPLLYTKPNCTLTTTFPANASNVVTTTIDIKSSLFLKDTLVLLQNKFNDKPLGAPNSAPGGDGAGSGNGGSHPKKSKTYSQFSSLWDKLQAGAGTNAANNTSSAPSTTRDRSDDSPPPLPSFIEILDIAAGNPDMARFQEKINDWLKKQSSILGSAFILTSNESNSCLCQVCGSDNLDEPIHCGDLDLLKSIFDFPALLNAQIVGQTTSEEKIRIQHRRQQFFDNPQLQTQPQDALAPVIDLRQLHRQNADLPLRGFCSILEHISALAHSAPSSECEDEAHTPSPSTSSPYSSSSEHMPNAVEQQQGLKHLSSTLRHAHKKHNRHATRYDTGATRLRKAKTHGSIESAENESERQRLLNDAPVNSIIGIQASCGFVAGLVLAHRDERSKAEDLEIILPHISLIATLMSIIDNVEEQKRLAQQTQRFLSMTQNVFSSLQDMNELVRNITREAKTLVQAEICSLFLLDKEHSELVAEVFEKNGTSDEYLTEIRMPLTQGIVGHVATTGNMMNVKNVYNHPYFYPKVDERTGFVTRNILCFPIKDEKGNLVGVAELCNKIGKKAFTRHDEQCAATFSVYCALSISHCLLYRKLQEAHRRSHMAAELLVQGSTLSIAPEDILRLTVRDIPSPSSFHPEFDHFSFVPRSIGTGDTYVEASLSMFKDLGFIDKYRLRRRTLARFLLMVQKGYRDVPYHNWSHAFAVGHFCYLLIRIPSVKSALTDLERFALLVACLCHDIDHRGTTNAFQLQSKTPLAQLYSSEGSVLERHHFAQTVTILGMDECNIFDQLTRQQYQNVLDCIREVILATDIAAHLRKVSHIKEMVEEGYNSQSTEHHYLLMCLLMTASDLSDQSKDFKNSKAIAENIYKEFFSQGDLEKQMGNNPIEMMDRDRACVPKIQLEFMDTVALPVFDYISRLLPDLGSTYESILMNKLCWQTLDHILQEEGHSSGSLDYLKDGELEGKVFSRLSQQEQNRGQVKAIFARSGALSAYSATKERDASNDKAADSDRAPTSSPNSSTTRSTTSATTTMES